MGGGTFVDGVRRWFHRKGAPISSSSSVSSTSNEKNLTPFEFGKEEDQEQHQFTVETDFDLSGLKLVKVPKRVNFPFPSSSYSAMDHHKKVSRFLPLFFLFLFDSLFIDLFLCFCF